MSVTRVRFLLELWRRSSLNLPVPRHDDPKAKDIVLPWTLRRPEPPRKDETSRRSE